MEQEGQMFFWKEYVAWLNYCGVPSRDPLVICIIANKTPLVLGKKDRHIHPKSTGSLRLLSLFNVGLHIKGVSATQMEEFCTIRCKADLK